MNINLKEVLRYLSDELLYDAFLEFTTRASDEELHDMQRYINSSLAFNSRPTEKK